MIEKKFRAYDKQYKLMGEVVELGLRKGSKTCMLYDGGQTYGNTENYELMQFTGLKDMNGKEIYDGDILRYGNENVVYVCMRDDKNAWRGFRPPFGWMYNHPLKDMKNLDNAVVIGNIYENEELLK